MKYLSPLAVLLVACYHPSEIGPDSGFDAGPKSDAALEKLVPVRYVPNETMIGDTDLVVGGTINADWNLDTGLVNDGNPMMQSTPIAKVVQQVGGPDLHVLRFRNLQIKGKIINLIAGGPAVIIARSIVIDAGATLSVNGRPAIAGGNTGRGTGNQGNGGGGGGGGFLTQGGSGGASSVDASQLTKGSAFTIDSLFSGGSKGGRDTTCSSGSSGSIGGDGGGAILLYASEQILVGGTVSANGTGGGGGRQCTNGKVGEGGGGGGSGGAIVLQAGTIKFLSASRLLAIGGGGGGGGAGFTGLGELPGQAGAIGGAGGNGAIYSGKGGDGGGLELPTTGLAGTHYTSGNMGSGGYGGGGGAAGYIELRSNSITGPIVAAPESTIVANP
jgi:hypothetical protein